MPRIEVPDDLTVWMTLAPELAAGLGGLSDAVYNKSRLPLRVRDIACRRCNLALEA